MLVESYTARPIAGPEYILPNQPKTYNIFMGINLNVPVCDVKGGGGEAVACRMSDFIQKACKKSLVFSSATLYTSLQHGHCCVISLISAFFCFPE